MIDIGWAEETARTLLEEPSPRRWAHTRGVAGTARTLAPILGDETELVTAAAWLHDVGYAPALASSGSGFHPLDGARYLRDVQRAEAVLCRLVARHSCAVIEAAERGLAADLTGEFTAAPRRLTDALIYCDMTTGPDGQRMQVERRLTEIRSRYGPGHVVSRTLTRSAPELTAAVDRIAYKLARCAPAARPPRLVPVLVDCVQPM